MVKALILLLGILALPGQLRADGMVIPQKVAPKVEIPDQQALIHFENGKEQLVIETSFVGEGTNFAWVVPLPAAPEVNPVSEHFFASVRQGFEPRLIHEVRPYFFIPLFLGGLLWLGRRAIKNEVSWLADLPMCLLLAFGAGLMGGHYIVGFLAFALALYTRLMAGSTANLGISMLVGIGFAAILTFSWHAHGFNFIQTLGSSEGNRVSAAQPQATLLSTQRAGLFDVATLKAENAQAVLQWLGQNGFDTPQSAEPALRDYIREGWVFVACKVRRDRFEKQPTALHPLAFTFAASAPVYPTRLTAVDNGAVAMDLFVFGPQRAAARHFRVERCQSVESPGSAKPNEPPSGLQFGDSEVLGIIGNATVGTKLSGRLTPKEMASDVNIGTSFLGKTGAYVFSYAGATLITLNVILPLGMIAWAMLDASRNSWDAASKPLWRSRCYLLTATLAAGLTLFALMPKVEIVSTPISTFSVRDD